MISTSIIQVLQRSSIIEVDIMHWYRVVPVLFI